MAANNRTGSNNRKAANNRTRKNNVHPLNLLTQYTHPRNIPPLIPIPNQMPNQMPMPNQMLMPNLEELNRRVQICEQFLIDYDEMYTYMKQQKAAQTLGGISINNLFFIMYKPPFGGDKHHIGNGSLVYLVSYGKHPDTDEPYYKIRYDKKYRYNPDDIEFLHITPLDIMDTVNPPKDVALNEFMLTADRFTKPADRKIIYQLEGISRETISKALFETRLQIYQYEHW